MNPPNPEKGKLLKMQNSQAKKKIDHFRSVVALLEIRSKHFEKLSKFPYFPLFLRAKYKLKQLEINADIISKNHFIQIYSERIVNTKYAENCLAPDPDDKSNK